MTDIRRSIDLLCSPEEAWRLISDPGELAHWLADDVELDACESGAPLRATLEDGSVREGVVEEVQDGASVRFRWWTEDFEESEVRLDVVALPGGASRVSVRERILAPALRPLAWEPRLRMLALAPLA